MAGCTVRYVDPAATNPASAGVYTRAESIGAVPRLVRALFSDAVFAQHYAEKSGQRGGAPVLQVAPVDNLSAKRNAALGAVRRDLESALRSSGWFLLSGDPAACDYVLRSEYRDIDDGNRVTHQLSIRLHDVASDLDVWTGADEIAKE